MPAEREVTPGPPTPEPLTPEPSPVIHRRKAVDFELRDDIDPNWRPRGRLPVAWHALDNDEQQKVAVFVAFTMVTILTSVWTYAKGSPVELQRYAISFWVFILSCYWYALGFSSEEVVEFITVFKDNTMEVLFLALIGYTSVYGSTVVRFLQWAFEK